MIALLVTISRGHQGNVCILDETSRTPICFMINFDKEAKGLK
jgi:hypothetical protein